MTAGAALRDAKVLVTGGTGRVARPVAELLAADNEVWCLARFTDPAARSAVEAQGIRTFAWDQAAPVAGSLDGLPDDFTHVMHAGQVQLLDDFDVAIETNAASTAHLMLHCRAAQAFLYVSSSVIYKRVAPDEHCYVESDPLGGTSTPTWRHAYGASKLATEGVVRGLAQTLGIPSTIARPSVAYGNHYGDVGNHGGLPVQLFRTMREGRPVPYLAEHVSYCSPVHRDDMVAHVPRFWAAASVPATVVNWGGDDRVGLVEMMEHIAALTGVPLKLAADPSSPGMVALDPARRRSLTGPCAVPWRDGVRRTLEEHFPGSAT